MTIVPNTPPIVNEQARALRCGLLGERTSRNKELQLALSRLALLFAFGFS